VLLERARRVAIGHCNAALKLGHDDDAHRPLRQRDQVTLDNEAPRNLHLVGGHLHQLVAGGPVRRRKVKCGLDGDLLLFRRRRVGKCRRIGAPRKRLARR